MDPVRVLESGRGARGAANFGATCRGPHDGSGGPEAFGECRFARGGCANREPDQSRPDG